MHDKVKAFFLFVFLLTIVFGRPAVSDPQLQSHIRISIPVGAYTIEDAEQGQQVSIEHFGRRLVPGNSGRGPPTVASHPQPTSQGCHRLVRRPPVPNGL